MYCVLFCIHVSVHSPNEMNALCRLGCGIYLCFPKCKVKFMSKTFYRMLNVTWNKISDRILAANENPLVLEREVENGREWKRSRKTRFPNQTHAKLSNIHTNDTRRNFSQHSLNESLSVSRIVEFRSEHTWKFKHKGRKRKQKCDHWMAMEIVSVLFTYAGGEREKIIDDEHMIQWVLCALYTCFCCVHFSPFCMLYLFCRRAIVLLR